MSDDAMHQEITVTDPAGNRSCTAFRVAVWAIWCIFLIGLPFAGCEEKFDIGELAQQPLVIIDTSYVLLDPPMGQFVGPRALLMGNDQLLYVADSAGNRVVMMNRAGVTLSERQMLHPISLGQDSRLDLLVGGEVVVPAGDTVGAIFRIHLVSANADSAHRLNLSRVDTVWREPAHPSRRFPGIALFGDNFYLAVRNGPDNSSFIDPDGRVLLFDRNDNFITPVPAFATLSGSGITNINIPIGIAAFPGVRDFVLIQSSEGVAYGAIWMRYEQSSDFVGWVPKYDPAIPEDRAIDFVRPYRYLSPMAVAIDPVRRDVFIADASLDSVFKFNSRGKFKSETFGRSRTNGAMVRPVGLAFFEKILYVLDGSRGTILRFRLTTDVPR